MQNLKNTQCISICGGKLVYQLIDSEYDGVKVYGLEISCSLFVDYDFIRIEDISSDYCFMTDMLSILADNVVTPCVAKEIISEYLATKFTV